MAEKDIHNKSERVQTSTDSGKLFTDFRTPFWTILTAWTGIVVVLLILDCLNIQQTQNQMARNEALAHFNKDQAFRFWAASHGGVYVPPSDHTPPNPFLSHIPDRDTTTQSGKNLTLMNPAYMLRKMMEAYSHKYGVHGHITSLKYFRKETAPDKWETSVLKRFEAGEKEASEFTEIDGKPYLRFMRPMITTKACLKCHVDQGYKIGDVRGGVSVSVPMTPYIKNQQQAITIHSISFGLLWILGLVGLGISNQRIKSRIKERDNAANELQKAHSELELRVKKRTAELEDLNKDLNLEIDEHQHTEAALLEREKILQNETESAEGIINSLPGLFYMFDEKKFVKWNNAWERITGYSPEELDKMYGTDFFEGADREHIAHRMQKVFQEGAATAEAKLITKDGTKIPYHFTGLRKELDGNLYLIGLGIDISSLKKAEEAIQEKAFLLDSSSAIIGTCDLDSRMTYVNPAFLNNLGFDSLDEILGRPFSEFWIVQEQLDDIMTALMDNDGPGQWSGELKVKRKDGSLFDTHVSAATVFDSSGKPSALMSTSIDISERKLAEEQIKASLKEKEILLREVHHRVKNNLQIIMSLLKLQADKIDNKQLVDLLKNSEERVKSMAIVHEKLYQAENFADVDFSEYVKTLTNNLYHSYVISPGKISLKLEVSDVSLELDTAIPCGLIINELVSNSLKYAFPQDKEGEIKIAIRSISEDDFILEVSDNGIGIHESIDFRHAETLGLHIVKMLTEYQLDGTVELNRDKGTNFQIKFKRQKYKART